MKESPTGQTFLFTNGNYCGYYVCVFAYQQSRQYDVRKQGGEVDHFARWFDAFDQAEERNYPTDCQTND